MELKWLEDFLSLAQTGSFSRSAEARYVTQPAFSRRIRALELWLGAPLIDRSTYPTTLTAEGQRFRETAEEAVRALGASRHDLRAATRAARHSVSVAALHTLALSFFPRWFREVEARTGTLGSRLLPDGLHNCLQAIVEGGYDFLLTFHHPGSPILLDPAAFPHLVVGADQLVPARSPAADAAHASLGYPIASFLGRVVASFEANADAAPAHHVNENAVAEALRHMAREGHGTAWLPRSLIGDDLASGRLVETGAGTPLAIRLYRNAGRARPAVEALWEAARVIAAETMPPAHEAF